MMAISKSLLGHRHPVPDWDMRVRRRKPASSSKTVEISMLSAGVPHVDLDQCGQLSRRSRRATRRREFWHLSNSEDADFLKHAWS
jgi:hypothetical protein